jgi:hypothetical protein
MAYVTSRTIPIAAVADIRFWSCAVQALLRSVAPVVAAEEKLGGKAVSKGWANVDEKKLEEWSMAGDKSLRSKVEQLWDYTYDEEYTRLFRRVSTHCAQGTFSWLLRRYVN